MNLILPFLAAGAIWYFNQGKEFIEHYQVKFLDASFDNKSTEASYYTKLYFNVKLDVNNITDFTGTLKSAKLDVYLKGTGKNLGYVTLQSPVTINKKSHNTVSIPVQIPTSSLVQNVTDLVNMVSEGKQVVLKITGKLNFNIGTLTVNEDYPVKLA